MENTPSPSTSAKNELISNIKEWIRLDTEISKKNAELKICKNAKTTLTKTLIQLMKTHNIDCFDINGGALLYKQRKSKQTISKKYLLAQVQEYFIRIHSRELLCSPLSFSPFPLSVPF